MTATHIISFLYKEAIWVGNKINLKIIHIISIQQKETIRIGDEFNLKIIHIIYFHQREKQKYGMNLILMSPISFRFII